MQGTPDLPDVLTSAINAALATVDTAMVCKVISYDEGEGTATLRPVSKRRVPNPEGGTLLEDYPDIPAVRVLHLGGADWAVHVPIKAQDTVVILCSKADFSEWLRTGEVSGPADYRLFRLAFAIAIPGIRRTGPQGASADDITFTHRNGFKVTMKASGTMEIGGATDSAALASKCNQIDTRIAATIASFIPGSGGASFATPYSAVGDTASAKLKVGG